MNIRVDGQAARVKVSPELYGIFYEEINHAGEGGLYGELVQNRDFEANQIPEGTGWAGNLVRTPNGWLERRWFANELHGWGLIAEGGAKGSIRQEALTPMSERNPHSMRLLAVKTGRRFGVANGGFWGMNFQQGHTYDLVFHARTEGGEKHDLAISLESAVGHRKYATKVIKGVGGPWKAYRCSLKVSGGDPRGRLAICMNKPGTVWFDFVSLFPRKTFKKRPNGMRPDVAQTLADLKPGFLRFPGGCVVEGFMLSNRIQWKNSIGPVDRRVGTVSLWAYYNTNGIGFHEYLQLAEDLGAEAMYVINAGMSCQFRHCEVCPPEALEGYVQETLDALEYAMGPADSTWGALRAANGRKEPFRIKYVEIGNENSGEDYNRHYKVFHRAIKERYPEIITIADNREMG
ncbi:MAG: alpha-L-arabinofuranosidase, partial [Planctomycetota bacterium]|nr:alpha-L-arabinofuranosidase [Planctomycetota bacterium]